MVRPDGGQILSGINHIIKEENFNIVKVYHTSKWDNLYELFHEKELNDMNNTVSDNIKINIWMSKKIYGNSSIILFLQHDKYTQDEDLFKKTNELKFIIREKYNDTRNGQFVIAVNADKANLELQHLDRRGSLCVVKSDEIIQFSQQMKEKGNYVPAYFNYIHCPDPNVEEIESEYNIMHNQKILTKKNILTNREYLTCTKMNTCNRP